MLAQFGAVSRECVEAMARGLLVMTPADWAVAVTGIAGPGGGSPEKPVGLVYLGLATPEGVWTERHLWPGDRRANKVHSAERALAWAIEQLSGASQP